VSHYSGIFIDGPMAGVYGSSGLDSQTVDGFQYQHRVLVRFKNGHVIGAWVPKKDTNIIALQKVFDVYEAAHRKSGK
jgi:hypothetical protein